MMQPIALIIEDDPTLATVFAKALQAANFQSEIVTKGHAAVERLVQVVPDVVVLDLHLPEVSGVKILDEILASERLVNTRVIIASADAELASTLRHRVNFVLEKPVSFHQLRLLTSRLHPDHKTGPLA